MSNVLFVGSGGAGGGFRGTVRVDSSTQLSIEVGSGGISSWHHVNHTTDGATSSLIGPADWSITCTGGTRGDTTSSSSGYAGVGGTVLLGNDVTVTETLVYTAGSDGAVSPYSQVGKTAGPIPSHDYGAAGAAQGGYLGGRVQASYNGFIKIVFKGEL